MRYQITHITTYTYSQPVTLTPHLLRLRPRSDSLQSLRSFSLQIDPMPLQQSALIDLDGNSVTQIWFDPNQAIATLTIKALSEVETHCTNPFAYVLEPWAVQLPIDYPQRLYSQLHPYLSDHTSNFPGGVDPVARQLANEIWHQTQGHTVAFLSEVNQRIYQTCGYQIRETGDPNPPGITWATQSGSCRDLTILFMEISRAMGLATRFVSGYQEGDPGAEELYLHAWVEVYLPGAGWRGYDPTHGLAVSDRHIALVASPHSRQTSPIAGAIRTGMGATSTLHYELTITPFDADT